MDAERLSKLWDEFEKRYRQTSRISKRTDIIENNIREINISSQLRIIDDILFSRNKELITETKNLAPDVIIYPNPANHRSNPQEFTRNITVRTIGPTQRILNDYWSGISLHYTPGNHVDYKRVSEDLNLLSACILIDTNHGTALFPGDTVDKAWGYMIEHVPVCNFVKVSHHGSHGALGVAVDLWGRISDNRKMKPIAVIAPYFPSDLPSETAITHISSYCSNILLTSSKFNGSLDDSISIFDEKIIMTIGTDINFQDIDNKLDPNEKKILLNLDSLKLLEASQERPPIRHFVLSKDGKWKKKKSKLVL